MSQMPPTHEPPRPFFVKRPLPGVTPEGDETGTVALEVILDVDFGDTESVTAQSGIKMDGADIDGNIWRGIIHMVQHAGKVGQPMALDDGLLSMHLTIECDYRIDYEDKDVTATCPTIKSAESVSSDQIITLEPDNPLAVALLNHPAIWEAVETAAEQKAVGA